MLKLEIGKTYSAHCRPNASGNFQKSSFTIIGMDADLFVGRGKLPGNNADHYRAFTSDGLSANGGAWSLYEEPAKPREFVALIRKEPIGYGFIGYLYLPDTLVQNTLVQTYESVTLARVVEVLPSA